MATAYSDLSGQLGIGLPACVETVLNLTCCMAPSMVLGAISCPPGLVMVVTISRRGHAAAECNRNPDS